MGLNYVSIVFFTKMAEGAGIGGVTHALGVNIEHLR
jgi:hypothetical protein